eukprot:8336919-Karenia_brevis.AAC.1
MSDTVSQYIHKYKDFIYCAPGCSIAQIIAQDIYDVVQGTDESAPGMDGWRYSEWQLLPPSAFHSIAHLYHLIESGCPWPQQTLHTRSHPLCKDPSHHLQPLSYRFLLLTPILYRVWGKLRLRHLQQWIDGWRMPCMFGGMPGVGAEDAWYLTAMTAELDLLEHNPHIGGTLDLYKCFDQVVRPLFYTILLLAGLPTTILTAYINFLEHSQIYNSFAGCVGQPHLHRCGIPQGCPLSMIFISLYLRSWIVQMHSLDLIPRTLADDILLSSRGDRALRMFKIGFTQTIEHLQDMGGRLAPHKSNIFASISTHRQWLASYEWPGIHQTIPVVQQLRDLGASINFTGGIDTTMSKQRLQRAIATVNRIAYLPHHKSTKCSFVRTAAHARGLYACETTHVDEALLRHYTSRILRVVGTHSQMHA